MNMVFVFMLQQVRLPTGVTLQKLLIRVVNREFQVVNLVCFSDDFQLSAVVLKIDSDSSELNKY